MGCVGINPGNLYLWISLAGIFFGGGFSFILTRKRRRNPVAFAVFLSLAILSALAAMVVSGFDITGLALKLYWLGACIGIGYLGFFFWKAAGIPLLFLFFIFTSLSWYSFSGWSCAGSGEEICSFSIISEGSGYLRVQYRSTDGINMVDKIDGGRVYPMLDIIIPPDYFFILDKGGLYRFYGFSSEAGTGNASGQEGLFSKLLLRLPGFRYISGSTDPLIFSPSIDYTMIFGSDGKPETIRNFE